MYYFLKFIFGIKVYMFRTVTLSIPRSCSLYTQQWYMSYRLADSLREDQDGTGSDLILLASCRQTCMTYTIAMCTVKNSWRWREKLSETCRVLFQKYIWEITASSWFYYKNLSRCTVTWTSKEGLWVIFCDTFVPCTASFNILLPVHLNIFIY